MRLIGAMLWFFGIVLGGYAFFVFDPSVSSSYGGGRVLNFGLQQQQMMMFVAAGVLFAVGAILHALSYATVSPAANVKPKAKRQTSPTDERALAARKLGIFEVAGAYTFNAETFATLDEAIKAAGSQTSR